MGPEQAPRERPPYSEITDEELIAAARAGDVGAEDHLYEKYKHSVKGRARSYFLAGADREDIIQEGMIGLYKAIRDFDPEKTGSFRNFADLCVTRQILTAVKAATRQKHIPLNSYVSFNKPLCSEEPERTLADVLRAARVSDPEETVISREALAKTEACLKSALSPLERQTLALYLEGRPYTEIAEILGKTAKTIDNALQRVKHKLERRLMRP